MISPIFLLRIPAVTGLVIRRDPESSAGNPRQIPVRIKSPRAALHGGGRPRTWGFPICGISVINVLGHPIDPFAVVMFRHPPAFAEFSLAQIIPSRRGPQVRSEHRSGHGHMATQPTLVIGRGHRAATWRHYIVGTGRIVDFDAQQGEGGLTIGVALICVTASARYRRNRKAGAADHVDPQGSIMAGLNSPSHALAPSSDGGAAAYQQQ